MIFEKKESQGPGIEFPAKQLKGYGDTYITRPEDIPV